MNSTNNYFKIGIALLISAFGFSQANAQCTITATATPTTLPCGGGQVQLDAVGGGFTTQVLGSDFNGGSAGPGWTVSAAGQFDNPCDASHDGGTYMWMGPTTAAPREMQTSDFDLSCGGNVCFWLDFSTQGGASPCEGPDLTTEGVYFEYSTTGAGGPWTLINYFQPNTATNAFTTWANYCYAIPAGAMTTSTRFRWYQGGSSGTCCDHWGIDDVTITSNNCGSAWLDWDNISPTTGPGGDPASQTVTVTSDTSFTVCYTDGGSFNCCETVNITVLGMQAPTAAVTHETCLGDNDGTIIVTEGINGTPAYTYSITGPVSQSNGTGNFTGLPPGVYTCVVTDGSGCTGSVVVTINAGPNCCTLAPTITGTNLTCNSANAPCDGTATANPVGAIGPPTYIWYDAGLTPIGQTTQTATGLCAGTYYVDVTDGVPCTVQVSIVITEPPVLAGSLDATTDVSCFGGNDGDLTVSATGGTTPYTFDIGSGPQASGNFGTLTQGNYTITVTDANGCTVDINATINEPTQLTGNTVSITDATCGNANGAFEVSAAGGTTPYTFDIGTGPQASGIFNGLVSGAYIVTVTDANGCTININVNVNDLSGITASITAQVDVTCFGGNDGSVTVVASGSVSPYTYDIGAGPQASGTFTNLTAGNYTVTAEDANGCQFPVAVVINEPTQLVGSLDATTDILCFGGNNGDLTVSATGGITPYTFDIGTGPQASGNFGALTQGNYVITATDANGCTVNINATINEPAQLTGNTVSITDATCGSANGAFEVAAAGGTTPYTFDIGTGPQASGIFSTLAAGAYIVTVTDANGCTTSINVNVNDLSGITASITAQVDVSCFGVSDGSVTVVASGSVSPYTYDIGAGPQASGTFTGLPAGSYTVTAEDANGCQFPVAVVINEPTQVVGSFDATTDVLCFGGNNGDLTFSATGGTTPYTFDIGTGPQASGTFSNLTAGPYTVTVTDANGCTVNVNGTVNEPTAVAGNLNATTDVLCFGGNNGDLTVTASGGISPYTYDIGAGPQPTGVFGTLTQGNYVITVTDNNGCTVNVNATINEPPLLDFTSTTVNSTCGAANGSLTMTGNGGTTPYMFDIGAGQQASGTFTGLTSGTYTGTITDANNCTYTTTINVVDAGAPTITNVAFTDPLCNASCDGTITITATGGISPLQYSIDGGVTFQASNVFNGVCDGNYNIVVEDANVCQASSSTTLTEPPVLSYSATATNLLCFQDNSGVINMSASGGTTPYQFSIDGGVTYQAGGAFNGVAANGYNVVVQDANGCTVTGVEVVDQPPQLTMNFSSFDAVCNGYCDGYAITIPAGGTTPYTYLWSTTPTNNSPTENNLCAGNYGLTITDANGCMVDTLNYPVIEPAPMQITNVTVTDELCMGDCQGSIDITSAGATSFSADGGVTWQPTGMFTNMCSGNYNIVVTDVTGCSATVPTSVASQAPIILTTSSDTTICIGGSANIDASAAGGVGVLTYIWDQGLPAGPSQNVPDVATTYNVYVQDANGCISSTMPITVNVNPPLQVTALSDASICPGESVSISSIGSGGDGGPYTYNWVDVLTGNPLVGQNHTISPTATGDYIVTLDDGCETPITTDVITITVNPTPSVAFTSDVTDGCIDLPVNFSNTTPPGEVGNNCIWDFGDGSAVSTDCVAPFHMYTVPGCYDVTLTVTSPEGCVGSTTVNNYICAYDLPIADFEFGPQPTTVVNPTIQFGNMSQNGVNYYWDFGTPNADPPTSTAMNPAVDFPSSEPGTYQVCLIAESAEGCTDTICQYVVIDDEFLIYVPNAFTPDGDGVNDIFAPVLNGYDPFDYQLLIFDRWGEVIFESSHPQVGWDGTVKGNAKLGKSEVYVWKINVRDNVNGEKKEYVGHVTLLK
jgi:gliding motility-associated-like protein